MTRYDKLGRRIPDFDRSKANKKGADTRREKDGADIFSVIGAKGGAKNTRGYLGKLKDEDPEKLKQISDKGNETQRTRKASNELRGAEE